MRCSFRHRFYSFVRDLLSFQPVGLVVLDWLISVAICPSFISLLGTEGLAGYSDYRLHLLIGIVISLLMSLLLAVIVTVLF